MGCILGMASTSSCCRLAGLPLPTPPHYPLTYTTHRNTLTHSLVELTLPHSPSAQFCVVGLNNPPPLPLSPVPRRSWCLSDGQALLADALCHRTTLQIREQKKQLADEMQVRL